MSGVANPQDQIPALTPAEIQQIQELNADFKNVRTATAELSEIEGLKPTPHKMCMLFQCLKALENSLTELNQFMKTMSGTLLNDLGINQSLIKEMSGLQKQLQQITAKMSTGKVKTIQNNNQNINTHVQVIQAKLGQANSNQSNDATVANSALQNQQSATSQISSIISSIMSALQAITRMTQ